MKKSRILCGLALLSSAFALTACETDNTTKSKNGITTNNVTKANNKEDKIKEIYQLYKAEGGTLTYEAWLDSIKGEKGDKGVGISKVEKTKTEGLVDTYTITFTDGTTTTYTITNGANGKEGTTGVGVASVEKTGTNGLVDTYTITYTDGTTTTFAITNGDKGNTGISVENVEKTSTEGLVDTYTITLTDGTTTTFTVTNGDKGNAGVGVAGVEKTSTEGLVDTYTITLTDGTTTTFTVTNGKDAEASQQEGIEVYYYEGNQLFKKIINIKDSEKEEKIYFLDGINWTPKEKVVEKYTDNVLTLTEVYTWGTDDWNGSKKAYEYDDANQVVTSYFFKDVDGTFVPDYKERYEYNADGKKEIAYVFDAVDDDYVLSYKVVYEYNEDTEIRKRYDYVDDEFKNESYRETIISSPLVYSKALANVSSDGIHTYYSESYDYINGELVPNTTMVSTLSSSEEYDKIETKEFYIYAINKTGENKMVLDKKEIYNYNEKGILEKYEVQNYDYYGIDKYDEAEPVSSNITLYEYNEDDKLTSVISGIMMNGETELTVIDRYEIEYSDDGKYQKTTCYVQSYSTPGELSKSYDYEMFYDEDGNYTETSFVFYNDGEFLQKSKDVYTYSDGKRTMRECWSNQLDNETDWNYSGCYYYDYPEFCNYTEILDSYSTTYYSIYYAIDEYNVLKTINKTLNEGELVSQEMVLDHYNYDLCVTTDFIKWSNMYQCWLYNGDSRKEYIIENDHVTGFTCYLFNDTTGNWEVEYVETY